MALQSSGPISVSEVKTELGIDGIEPDIGMRAISTATSFS